MHHRFTSTTTVELAGVWSTLDNDPPRCTWTYVIADRVLRVTRGAVMREQKFPFTERPISLRALHEQLPRLVREIANRIEQPRLERVRGPIRARIESDDDSSDRHHA
jgi:hypothetical protein